MAGVLARITTFTFYCVYQADFVSLIPCKKRLFPSGHPALILEDTLYGVSSRINIGMPKGLYVPLAGVRGQSPLNN